MPCTQNSQKIQQMQCTDHKTLPVFVYAQKLSAKIENKYKIVNYLFNICCCFCWCLHEDEAVLTCKCLSFFLLNITTCLKVAAETKHLRHTKIHHRHHKFIATHFTIQGNKNYFRIISIIVWLKTHPRYNVVIGRRSPYRIITRTVLYWNEQERCWFLSDVTSLSV